MHNCMDYICITWATYAQLYGLHMHNYMDYICISIWTTYASFIFKTVMSGTHTHAGWRTVYERREVIPKMAALQSIVHGLSPISNVGTEPRVLSFPQYARFVENAKRLTKNMVKTGWWGLYENQINCFNRPGRLPKCLFSVLQAFSSLFYSRHCM